MRPVLREWAERGGTVVQLRAWGYADVSERLPGQLHDLAVATSAAAHAVAGELEGRAAVGSAPEAIASYSDHLHALGLSLTSFATPLACSNPGCGNLGGASEAALVGGRSCVCGGCRVARYCGRDCQHQHWKAAHKPVCKALAAAQAGGGC